MSVRRSVRPSVPRYFQTRTRRILCRVSGLVVTQSYLKSLQNFLFKWGFFYIILRVTEGFYIVLFEAYSLTADCFSWSNFHLISVAGLPKFGAAVGWGHLFGAATSTQNQKRGCAKKVSLLTLYSECNFGFFGLRGFPPLFLDVLDSSKHSNGRQGVRPKCPA